MIRRCADEEYSAKKPAPKRNGHDHKVFDYDEDMDLDEDGMDENGEAHEWDMEVEDEYGEGEAIMMQDDALSDALEYGRQLQEDFKDKPEMRKSLDEAFSLFAYTNPMESVVSHLLDEEGRLPVAEELNSAILGEFCPLNIWPACGHCLCLFLVSLGKSSKAPLELLVQQTTVLLREVANEGGPAALINLQDWISSPEMSSA